ncbi:hypothetical protein FHS18_001573 [Paenibacillus phyllosphaerae]|uniref:YolD-like protein n=1 Tax=Paenibacillus phyllosphaerae TaxID=274593 RepID=A0A7W5AWS0_9BACL|nr:YolD-like family protein [Paenibacillus phyllosphaerae]MBB3109521.1 hypothetical protein [Paenibacillus phyllosphaerae]
MSKKLQGNGLFESSRMMLFEHRDALIARQQQPHPASYTSRRGLDEQHREEIAARLGAALSHGSPIRLTVADYPDNRIIEGIITRYDAAGRRIRLNDEHWVRLENIIDMEE